MSSKKWTKGEWLYGEDGFNLGNGVVYARPVGGGIVTVATIRHYGAEQKANAQIIASAPKLYEALEYAVKQVPELGDVPGIRDALASARGES